ncbi:hypothetical protein IWC96_04935 [Brevundimonas sp. BAL450]|jgi:Skp family chaperone for outer membrane proteins|uniref:hypothetical protein n=1 Tax=Brevundimonas TaxID=41275 RepID=UPI0018CA3762|nr:MULTISPECIES: hypothetical protein [Brevundimonas]MBG7614626.1 hypothetical protein [Brevundimonas sp. BAL450]
MLRISLLAALTLAVAMPAAAQDAVDDLFANPPEAEERIQTPPPRPAEPTPVEEIAPVDKPAYDPETEETQRLNAAVEAYNQSVRQTNASAQAEYEQSLRDHAAWVARLEEEHLAEQAAYEAEVLRRQQEHEANLAAWRRRVAACQAGDISQCDPSTIR